MGVCKYCGVKIIWEQLISGKWVPYDLDGTSHFDTCLNRPRSKDSSDDAFPLDNSKIKLLPGQKGIDEFDLIE